MGKKNFSEGLNILLGEKSKSDFKNNKSTKNSEFIESTTKLDSNIYTRATFVVNSNFLDSIKAIAYWDRLKIKDVINSALNDYILSYEKKNGKVKVPPK